MPWALGTMHAGSQIVSLALSILGMWLALAPRELRMPGGNGTAQARLWPKLARFPLFWAGLALLIYVFLQGVNPSWVYERNSDYWWLRSRPNVAWLPTSIQAPFLKFNVWRQLIVYADMWLLVCTVWVGLTRRRSLRILLAVLVGNAVAMTALLVWERVAGAIRAPASIVAATDNNLTSSFIYENHAGAYFSLIAFSAIALSTWYFDYGRRRLLKSTPSGVWGLAAALLAGTIFFTLSRGAVLSFALSLALYGLWQVMRRVRRPSAPDSNPAVTATLATVFFIFAAFSIHFLDFSVIFGRFNSLANQKANEPNVSSRLLARSAAVDMIEARGLRGVGAGSFRYLYTEYVKNYPPIYQGGHQFWEHAHCDWLEIPIELGLAGSLLPVIGAGWGAVWFLRRRFVWNPLAVPILLGCLATFLHAGFDFPFQCPAILAAWCVLIAVAARSVELEQGG
jgi:O-antigen ligase